MISNVFTYLSNFIISQIDHVIKLISFMIQSLVLPKKSSYLDNGYFKI